MPKSIFESEVITTVREARKNGKAFPSPTDWRDNWIYFLMLDRFNNPAKPPFSTWNRKEGKRQGGTFVGVTQQLDYIRDLGAGAIWITPVLKNPRPDYDFAYHGYAAQDFLTLDERFASDGKLETAEKELIELVKEAHKRGLYVILDIVLNHAGRVFDYVRNGRTEVAFEDGNVINGPLGSEPPVRWLNGFGFPRPDWENRIDLPNLLSPDDAVYPEELRNHLFFRRRGTKVSDFAPAGSFAKGDFGSMRQLAVEYDASVPGQEAIRDHLGPKPVLNVLIHAYQYLIAKYDFDAFRIDTVKYVDPGCVEIFGNSIREFAQSIGKRNFFTFGEIYDDEQAIANFVGRNASQIDSYGIDAALDFPLFFKLPGIAKGQTGVEQLREIFANRKSKQSELLSTHGEAGRFFVSFLDNHDQNERFHHPFMFREEVTLGLALLYFLQGIPCLYYGTEQELTGTVDGAGKPELNSFESTREALWGKTDSSGAVKAFDKNSVMYQAVKKIAVVRAAEAALRFGRLYFREVSANGNDFGQSTGAGGIVAFSRILGDQEVTVVANTNSTQRFTGFVLQEIDLNRPADTVSVVYSNINSTGKTKVETGLANFYNNGNFSGRGPVAKVFISLAPREVQVLSESET